MPNPVVHFEILSEDGEQAQQFYSQLFDWTLDTSFPGGYGMLQDPGDGIAGGIGAAREGSPGYLTIYVQVEDLQAALDKAEGLGGKTVMPPTEVPGQVTFALMSDPAGHIVGLVKGG